MTYPITKRIIYPLKNYKVNSFEFLEECVYDNVFWGKHLGEDVNVKAGANVKAIGQGKVVLADFFMGSKKKRNWGGVVIIAHKNPKTKENFFSLYGHLGKIIVQKEDKIRIGQVVGKIAKRLTPENGWWEDSHLHFAIYKGKWKGKALPGYFRKVQNLTNLKDWTKPSEFINDYGKD